MWSPPEDREGDQDCAKLIVQGGMYKRFLTQEDDSPLVQALGTNVLYSTGVEQSQHIPLWTAPLIPPTTWTACLDF